MNDDHPPLDPADPPVNIPVNIPGTTGSPPDTPAPSAEGAQGVQGDDEDEDGLFPAPVTQAPRTGDRVIDEALAGLEESARSGDLDAQVTAGERVHRQLQERLDDLGGA